MTNVEFMKTELTTVRDALNRYVDYHIEYFNDKSGEVGLDDLLELANTIFALDKIEAVLEQSKV